MLCYGEQMATTEHAARRRAGHTMLRFDEATAATEHGESSADYARIQRSNGSSDRHASRRREQVRLCIATAELRRSNGRDISCTRDGESSADYACYAGPTRTRTPATGIRVAHTEHHRHTLHPLRAARGEARTPNNFRGDVTVRTTHAVGMTVTGPAVRRQCL